MTARRSLHTATAVMGKDVFHFASVDGEFWYGTDRLATVDDYDAVAAFGRPDGRGMLPMRATTGFLHRASDSLVIHAPQVLS